MPFLKRSSINPTVPAPEGGGPSDAHWGVFWALVVCVLFYTVNNAIWLDQDRSSPSYDKAAHAKFALEYLRLFEAPTRLSLAKLLKVTQYWPPFFHIASVPVTMAFGFSAGTVAATNFLFLPVAVFGIYSLGRRLFDERVGLGAVALTLLYPLVYALSRAVLVDFALTAMVSLTLCLVVATNGGLDRRRSWMLGLAAACAMLTKWTAVVFLAGPWIYWLARSWRRERPARRPAIAALGAAAFVFLLVALPWYVKSLDTFLSGARIAFGSDPAQEGDPVRVVDSVVWYWATVRDAVMRWPLLVSTLAGLLACALWCRARPSLLFLAFWILPAFAFFVLIPNKDARFVVPMLPAVAMLAAAGVQSIPSRVARRAFWTITVTAGVLQFYMFSFGWPVVAAQPYTDVPRRPHWRVAGIVNEIATLNLPHPIRVAVVPNDPDFEPNLFILAADVDRLPLQIGGVGYIGAAQAPWALYDVIISKTGSISVPYAEGDRMAIREDLTRRAKGQAGPPRIVLWRTWPLPDGSNAEVYLVSKRK